MHIILLYMYIRILLDDVPLTFGVLWHDCYARQHSYSIIASGLVLDERIKYVWWGKRDGQIDR